MVNDREREVFDGLLERHVASLPAHVAAWLEEVPVIVEDEADAELLIDAGLDPEDDDLCGLHSGVPLTERSVEDGGAVPDDIRLFRGPIMRLAGWSWRSRERGSRAELSRQVRITLLHELGHHFGLDEEDLDELGYG